MRVRAAVVIEKDNNVALIKRERAGMVYYVFPGGGVENGESFEHAAIREAKEELGVEVELHHLIKEIQFGESRQLYYKASIIGGTFGSGQGPEFSYSPELERGSYTPVWIHINDLSSLDVRPKEIAQLLTEEGS